MLPHHAMKRARGYGRKGKLHPALSQTSGSSGGLVWVTVATAMMIRDHNRSIDSES